MDEQKKLSKPTGSLFETLQSANEETFEKILIRLLDPKDFETKTQIDSPRVLAQFEALARWLETSKCKKSAKTIRSFVAKYLIYQISKDRQSRREIIHALTEGLKREKSMAEKLGEQPA